MAANLAIRHAQVLDFHFVPEQPQMLHRHLNVRGLILEAHLQHAICMAIAPGRTSVMIAVCRP